MTQSLNRFRILVLAVAALLMLALPAASEAKKGGNAHSFGKWAKRNHVRGAQKDADKDGLSNRGEFLSRTNPRKPDSDRDGVLDANEDPDRDAVDNANEVRERTNPRRRDSDRDRRPDGQEDADRDRLNNTGEDQSGNDPIKQDTDGDGVKDGDEGAGKIVEFDGSRLVLRLFSGATLAGAVDEDTDVWCEDESADDEDLGDDFGDDESGDDSELRIAARDSADDDEADGLGDDDFGDDEGDEGDDLEDDDLGLDDEDDDSGPSCSVEDLEVGAVVRSASIDFGQDGSYFSAIELAP